MMKTAFILLLCSFFVFETAIAHQPDKTAQATLVISKNNPTLQLVTSNVCYNTTQLIVCKGDPFLGINPSLGWSCTGWSGSPSYTWLFDFNAGANMNGITISDSALAPAIPRPFFVSHDSIIKAYTLSVPQFDCVPIIALYDSTVVPDLLAMHANHDRLITISNKVGGDNVNIFNLQLQPLFNFALPFYPQRLFVNWGRIVITGTDTSGSSRLFVYDLFNAAVLKDTLLGPLEINSKSMNLAYPYVNVLATPGDSVIAITRYNIDTGQLNSSIVYSQSGVQAVDYDQDVFYYQTFADSTPQATHLGITAYYLSTGQSAFYNKGQRYSLISQPNNRGNSWSPSNINVVLENATNNHVIVIEPASMMMIDTLMTSNHAAFFANDFRCPVSVEEYNDDQTEIIMFPNPTDGVFTVHMKGLICNRDYLIDVIDLKGNVVMQKQVQAKHTYTLDFDNLKAGTYVLRLHTQQGLKTRKIIKL